MKPVADIYNRSAMELYAAQGRSSALLQIICYRFPDMSKLPKLGLIYSLIYDRIVEFAIPNASAMELNAYPG